jgi:hypothetical protein
MKKGNWTHSGALIDQFERRIVKLRSGKENIVVIVTIVHLYKKSNNRVWVYRDCSQSKTEKECWNVTVQAITFSEMTIFKTRSLFYMANCRQDCQPNVDRFVGNRLNSGSAHSADGSSFLAYQDACGSHGLLDDNGVSFE